MIGRALMNSEPVHKSSYGFPATLRPKNETELRTAEDTILQYFHIWKTKHHFDHIFVDQARGLEGQPAMSSNVELPQKWNTYVTIYRYTMI